MTEIANPKMWFEFASWLSNVKPDFALGAFLGLTLSPVQAAISRWNDRQTVRRILYDDVAYSYAVIAKATNDLQPVWAAASEALLDTKGMFEDILLYKDPDAMNKRREKRQEVNETTAEELKKKVLPLVRKSLSDVSLQRYEAMRSEKLLVLFELREYQAIEDIFNTLRLMQDKQFTDDEIYNYIGWYRARFQRLNRRMLKSRLKKRVKEDLLQTALTALKKDVHVGI